MKKILLIICLSISIGTFAQIQKVDVQANGLTCSMCSRAIYKALTALPFIKEVRPDIERSSYRISFKDGVQPDLDAIAKAITDAGFSIAKLQATINFNDAEVKNDAHVMLDGKAFHFLHVADQKLHGPTVVTLVDKNFVSTKEFKKYGQYTTMKCYATGMMESCCAKNMGATSQRIYHVTI